MEAGSSFKQFSVSTRSPDAPPDRPRATDSIARALARWRATLTTGFIAQLATVFVAYYLAGKLGQATTSIRSSNLGPVWPASGIALAAFLLYGYRIWPAVWAGAFLVAAGGSGSYLGAGGQAIGAALGAATGAFLLHRIPSFEPSLSRLRDAIGFIVLGAFGSALVSSVIGMYSLLATGVQPYSGLTEAWSIYWLGDGTGVLIITPLVFTLPRLFAIRSPRRIIEFAALLTLLTATCFVVFGDLPLFPIRLHVLAFAVLPFVMWGAINFGIGGSALCVFLIATIATLLTALGSGPFAANTPFLNAALLDVLFAVLAISGMMLAAVIAERESAEASREGLIRQQAAIETRLRLASIVESSEDAIVSTSLNGVIRSWNAAAERIFGYRASEIIGQPITVLIPVESREEEERIVQRLRKGERTVHFDTVRLTKTGRGVDVSLTISPLRDAEGTLVGESRISRDVSAQKRAEEALSSVNRKLIEAQEQERARIARDLHDDIGQRLALLTAELTDLHGAGQSKATKLRQQAAEIAADVQALSHTLHSSKLELLGIARSIKLFCREFEGQQKGAVDFEATNVPVGLPSDVSLCLFRILQEALHNSAKHSGASRFHVRLWGAADGIHLIVADEGSGFNVESSRTSRGIGLVTMEERIRLVQGLLSIESAPGRGTTVHARVPLEHADAPTPPQGLENYL